jgi:hypothetical protein
VSGLREDWLNRLVCLLRPHFLEEAGVEVPEKVRVSCGWPSKSARATKNRRIGECWDHERSGDKHWEIFISPTEADSIEVGAILVHELVHTVVGTKVGHRAPFRRVAVAMGLEGKMTATQPGEALQALLGDLIKDLGPYPHGEITFKTDEKKQSTRMLKLECPNCGYAARTTRKWLELGTPTCVCETKMQAV